MPRIINREQFYAQGRLTLTTAVPFLIADVSGASTIYYSPASGNLISLYSGSEFLEYEFAEISQTLADDTKSPAAAGNDSIYDMFVWNDAGTLRCTRGYAWTSDTARGTGPGTTELERVKGVLLNKAAITNGPAAQRGTYVGSIRTNAAGTVDMQFRPAVAAGGTDNRLYLWNNFNRRQVTAICRDGDNTWTYDTATLRPMNNDSGGAGTNTKNRISFLIGIAEELIYAKAVQAARNSTIGTAMVGAIGYDATDTLADGCLPCRSEAARASTWHHVESTFQRMAALGAHYVQALEYSGAATGTWAGDGGAGSIVQCGLTFRTGM